MQTQHTPPPESPPRPAVELRTRGSLAAHTFAALVTWLEQVIHADLSDGVDAVMVPIVTPTPRPLQLIVDRPGPFTVACRDREVVRAALALDRAGLLDDLLGDIKLDREGEELFDFAFPATELPAMVWQMWRAAERMLDRASWLEVSAAEGVARS